MSVVTSVDEAAEPVTTPPAPQEAPPAATPARVAAALAVVVALVGAVLGPTGQFDALLDGGVIVASGTVEVLEDETWQPVPIGRTLRSGSTVRTPDGTATLEVAGGAVDMADGTRMVVGSPLTLRAGSLVVRSPRVTAGDGAVTAHGGGPWRFDATGRVGAYTGAPLLTDAAGREVLVRPLEEARVADGVVEGAAQPYVYVGSDEFDRRYLASAIDVDEFVGSLRRGLVADYGTAPQERAFYTDFDGLDGAMVSALGDVGFERAGDRVGPPADVLVAAVVADALVTDAGLAPEEAGDEVRTKRLAGATWGLIAQARELEASHVRAAADRALQRRQQLEEQGTATPVLTPDDGTGAPAEEEPGEAEPADTAPQPTPGDDEDGTAPDDGSGSDQTGDDEPGPVGGIVDETGATELLPEPLDDTVDDTVGLVDDVVGSVTGSSSNSTEDDDGLLGTTGEVIEDTTDTVEDTVGGLLGGD